MNVTIAGIARLSGPLNCCVAFEVTSPTEVKSVCFNVFVMCNYTKGTSVGIGATVEAVRVTVIKMDAMCATEP